MSSPVGPVKVALIVAWLNCGMTKPLPPLAERMRPRSLDDVAGQAHLTGANQVLRRMYDSGRLTSMILWGPPGTGKTTLARILGGKVGLQVFSLSAVDSGVKEVRKVIETAAKLGQAVLFIDEIHRFSKSQQDSLLHAVEKGIIILIGATTENPSFEVISPLLSRCQVYVLQPLDDADLLRLLRRALTDDEWLSKRSFNIEQTSAMFRLAGGDARRLYNLIELLAEDTDGEIVINDESVLSVAQQKLARYDKAGEQHYDIISAFIKSIRGSDPNAALYWLARMTEAGEDPKFIARRLVILASEDIGNANPNALTLANAAFDAVEKIGYPECVLNLAQAVTYLASSPKSNASYLGIQKAIELVRKTGDLPVPLHLRNAPTRLMRDMSYGKDYQYAHDFEDNFAEQEYLPEKISGEQLYDPGGNPREDELRRFLRERWKDKYHY